MLLPCRAPNSIRQGPGCCRHSPAIAAPHRPSSRPMHQPATTSYRRSSLVDTVTLGSDAGAAESVVRAPADANGQLRAGSSIPSQDPLPDHLSPPNPSTKHQPGRASVTESPRDTTTHTSTHSSLRGSTPNPNPNPTSTSAAATTTNNTNNNNNNNGGAQGIASPSASGGGSHQASPSNRLGADFMLMSAAAATPMVTPRKGRTNGPALCVFSGGTAFNVVAGRLRQFTDRVAYILPVSDDGGSTAEIVRVLGGPAVGDIRSRCLRLADDSDEEARAVKTLLAHRLHPSDPHAAKQEWYTIVEGDGPLWDGVSEPYKHVIRAFLVHFHTAILRQSMSEGFNFCNGSIGNFFFAGSRNFFRSLEAAIFLFSRVARIPEGSLVLPAICTEERITLGAELEDGTVLRGQNQISHPPQTSGLAGSAGGALQVDKSHSYDLLPSPIRRVFYLSSEGSGQEHEVTPKVNPRAIHELERADAVIYGMGSLYTSICPIICLDGMGEAIAQRDVPKVLCLNGSLDRETASSGAHEGAMTASDIVQAVCDALNRRRNRRGQRLRHPPSAYVTGLLIPRGGSIRVDHQALALLGIRHVMEVESVPEPDSNSNARLFEPSSLVLAIEKMIAVLNSGETQETLTSLGVTI